MRTLAEDFEQVWSVEPANMSLKKRIARAPIEEIVVDISPAGTSVDLVIHWKGGVHTALSVGRRRRGQHFQATSPDDVDAIRVLARVGTDDRIAQALDRSGSRTGKNQVWTRSRVKDASHSHQIAVYDAARHREDGWLKLGEAAAHLGVTPSSPARSGVATAPGLGPERSRSRPVCCGPANCRAKTPRGVLDQKRGLVQNGPMSDPTAGCGDRRGTVVAGFRAGAWPLRGAAVALQS